MTDTEARITAAGVSDQPLDVEALAAAVADDKAGATVTFTGVVRNHDAGRSVTETFADVIGYYVGRCALDNPYDTGECIKIEIEG